jgi:protoporphyrinogen oxidase
MLTRLQKGGSGAMWDAVANMLPKERVRYNSKVVALDLNGKNVSLADGTVIHYKNCISSIPLDYILRMLGEDRLASRLFFSSSHVVGIGLRGVIPHGKKSWLYYPEEDCPFYRCTCFSLYAKDNCPDESHELPTIRIAGHPDVPPSEPKAGPYWSLMFEISESPLRPINPATVIEETLQGALRVGLIFPEDEIVSVYHRRLPHGYPTPTVIRDSVLREVLPRLKSKGFYSRGRFGAYKYEVANQDHSLLQGVEAVDNILFGATEMTFEYPSLVAKERNVDLFFTWPEDEDTASAAPGGQDAAKSVGARPEAKAEAPASDVSWLTQEDFVKTDSGF